MPAATRLVVFDVGNWKGYYALLAGSNKVGNVVALEIDNENIEQIERNESINHAEIEIIQVAASNKKSITRFDAFKSSSMKRIDSQNGEVVVKCETIDNIANG